MTPPPTVLVVDDEPSIRTIARAYLEQAGYRVVCVDNGPDAREVSAGGRSIDLTPTEFELLLTLANHPNHTLTREQLIDRVWGADFYGTDRVVDVYVGQVRRKIEAAAGATVIRTVRGVGYRFTDARA